MRPWIKRTFIGLFGASVLMGGLAACSHRPGWGSMNEAESAQFRERMIERVGSKLELDAAQKERLAVLTDKLREQRQALMGGSDPRADMRALVAGAKFDRERANTLVVAKTDALRAKSPEVIAAAADFYDSLRPEQQQKVREFMERRRGGHRWWGHG